MNDSPKKGIFARKLDFESHNKSIEELGSKHWKLIMHGRSTNALTVDLDNSQKILKAHSRKLDIDENPFSPSYQQHLAKNYSEPKKRQNVFDVFPPFSDSSLKAKKRQHRLIDSRRALTPYSQCNNKNLSTPDHQKNTSAIPCTPSPKKFVIDESPTKDDLENKILRTPKRKKTPNAKMFEELSNLRTLTSPLKLEGVTTTSEFSVANCSKNNVAAKCGQSPTFKYNGVSKWRQENIEKESCVRVTKEQSPCFIEPSQVKSPEKKIKKYDEINGAMIGHGKSGNVLSPSFINSSSFSNKRKRQKFKMAVSNILRVQTPYPRTPTKSPVVGCTSMSPSESLNSPLVAINASKSSNNIKFESSAFHSPVLKVGIHVPFYEEAHDDLVQLGRQSSVFPKISETFSVKEIALPAGTTVPDMVDLSTSTPVSMASDEKDLHFSPKTEPEKKSTVPFTQMVPNSMNCSSPINGIRKSCFPPKQINSGKVSTNKSPRLSDFLETQEIPCSILRYKSKKFKTRKPGKLRFIKVLEDISEAQEYLEDQSECALDSELKFLDSIVKRSLVSPEKKFRHNLEEVCSYNVSEPVNCLQAIFEESQEPLIPGTVQTISNRKLKFLKTMKFRNPVARWNNMTTDTENCLRIPTESRSPSSSLLQKEEGGMEEILQEVCLITNNKTGRVGEVHEKNVEIPQLSVVAASEEDGLGSVNLQDIGFKLSSLENMYDEDSDGEDLLLTPVRGVIESSRTIVLGSSPEHVENVEEEISFEENVPEKVYMHSENVNLKIPTHEIKSPEIFKKIDAKVIKLKSTLETQCIDEFNTETLHLAPPTTKGERWSTEGRITEILSEEREKRAANEAVAGIDLLPGCSKKKKSAKKGSISAEFQLFQQSFASERRVRDYERQKANGLLPGGREFQVLKAWGRIPRIVLVRDEDGEALLALGQGLLKTPEAVYPGCCLRIYPPWNILEGSSGDIPVYTSITTCEMSFGQLPQDGRYDFFREVSVSPYLADSSKVVLVLLNQPVPELFFEST